MRRTRRGRRHRGFTLVEMVIAALILVIGVVAAMGAISATTRTEGYANQIQVASLLAQRQLSEIATQPSTLAGGGDQEGVFDEPYSGYHWKATVESTDYQNLFKVTMTVTWGGKPRTYQREITTYLRSDQNTINQDVQTNYQNYQNTQNSSSTGTGTTGGTTNGQ